MKSPLPSFLFHPSVVHGQAFLVYPFRRSNWPSVSCLRYVAFSCQFLRFSAVYLLSVSVFGSTDHIGSQIKSITVYVDMSTMSSRGVLAFHSGFNSDEWINRGWLGRGRVSIWHNLWQYVIDACYDLRNWQEMNFWCYRATRMLERS